MQESYRKKDHYLKTYFNIPFVHINGDKDHFSVFKPRSLAVEKDIRNLESTLKVNSKYKLIFHSGGHNYNLGQVKGKLDQLYSQKRELYQEKIFPLFQKMLVKDSRWGT